MMLIYGFLCLAWKELDRLCGHTAQLAHNCRRGLVLKNSDRWLLLLELVFATTPASRQLQTAGMHNSSWVATVTVLRCASFQVSGAVPRGAHCDVTATANKRTHVLAHTIPNTAS